jgi:mRNA (guanine-N7-)-methyltransferase
MSHLTDTRSIPVQIAAAHYAAKVAERHYNKHAAGTGTGPKVEKELIKPLSVFHNKIKKDLITFHSRQGKRHLDIACGRGGDINKWVDAKLKFVFGVDVSPNEINFARIRYKDALDKYKSPITQCEFEATRDIGIRSIEWPIEFPQVKTHFDSVSCMFAAHYFFVSEYSLDCFFSNVASALKPGGVFYGTLLLAPRVIEFLNGKKEVSNSLLRIENKWLEEEATSASSTSAPAFGATYTFDLRETVTGAAREQEAGGSSMEYLVSPEIFMSVAGRHGLVAMEASDPRNYFTQGTLGFISDNYEEIPDLPAFRYFKPHYKGEGAQDLMAASRLNAAFVFAKGSPVASEALKAHSGTKTYLPMIEWLNKRATAEVLEPLGYRAVTLEQVKKYNTLENPVDLIIVDSEFTNSKELYGVPARMKGRIDSLTLNNKIELHKFMTKYDIKGIADTIVVEKGVEPKFPAEGGVWIWRPEGGWSGAGVHVIDSAATLKTVWEGFKSKKKRALISKYIMNPLLIDGFKFHVRIYMIVVSTPEGKRAAIYKRGIIALSKKPYEARDFGNVDIHDTHINDKSRHYPDDFPGDIQSFKTQMITILNSYFTKAQDDIKWYPESNAGYELYGCDFMIDKEGKVYLIEINSKPGFGCRSGCPLWCRTYLGCSPEEAGVIDGEKPVRHDTRIKGVDRLATRRVIGGLAEFGLTDPHAPVGAELENVIVVFTTS